MYSEMVAMEEGFEKSVRFQLLSNLINPQGL